MEERQWIVVRGGGDLATGVVQKFFRAGFAVAVLETAQPTAIRRTVALCEAVYEGTKRVEDVTCRRITSPAQAAACCRQGQVPLLVDPAGDCLAALQPAAVVDAILAKRNLGTHRSMAPVTIALGPGFTAGTDVDAVIETMRGHDLGRLLLCGAALDNTGVPGEIGGQSARRVIHAPAAGVIEHHVAIGDVVKEGAVLFTVGGVPAKAPFTGLLRGLIREGLNIPRGMKAADIDPRTGVGYHTISDKARCLGGAALEAYLYLARRKRAAEKEGSV